MLNLKLNKIRPTIKGRGNFSLNIFKVLFFLIFVNLAFTLHASDDGDLKYGEESIDLENFVLSWYQNVLKGKTEIYLQSIYWPDQMAEKEILDYKNDLSRSSKLDTDKLKFHAGSSSVHERYAVVYIYVKYMHRENERVDSRAWYLIKADDNWKIYPRSMQPKTPKLFENLREISKHRFRTKYSQTILKQNIHELQ